MKKSLFFAGLAFAALSLAGCNKETDVPDLDGRPVDIILATPDTRTVNDGMSTKWVDGDPLNVFYAPAGTETYSANKKFTISDAENNVASGTVSLTAESNDWYLLYAYASQISTPANTSGGYSYIGCRSDGSQQQTGYDNMAHLAGCSASSGFPLYGIAKNVPADGALEVTMKHVASAIAVKVKNDTEAPITITKVEFTAPEVIVGSFYVNFTQDPVILTPHATFTSKTASLTVKDAPALDAGATATFYMGIKPFTAASGSKLTLRITANEGAVEKEVTLGSAVDFTAGSIKTLNVGYANASVLPAITIGDIKSSLTSTSTVNFEGTLSGAIVTFVSADKKYAFIQDAADGIVLYRNSGDITLKAGDALSGAVNGAGTVYKNLKEITSLTVENIVSGQAVPAPLELSLADLNADYDKYVSYRVKVKGVTVKTAFSNRSTTMADGEESLALRDQKNGLTITAGKYDIVGYASYFTDAQFGVWNQDDIIPVQTDEKIFDVPQVEFTVGPDVTSVQINVTGNVDWTVTPGDGITSVSPEEGSGEGTVTVTFPANTAAEDKEYSLLIRTEASGVENDEFEISIMQAGLSAKAYPYVESFADGQGDFSINNVSLGDGLTYVWIHGTHDDDKFMKATAYVSGNKASESWLISPLVDLAEATNPALTFKHAIKYFTSIDKAREEATVWVRVKGGSWTQLEGITYPATQNLAFVESGSVSLSSYVGEQVQIGFKYVSTTDKAGTWEVTDFKIAELSGSLNPTFSVPATLSVDKGGTAKIDVTTNSDGAVTFTSANPGVATVAEDGTVTGVAVGSTTVTVAVAATSRYSAASGTVTVTVSDPGLHNIVAADFGAPSFVAGEYVVTSAKGTGGSNPNYVSGDKDIRLYAGNTITVKNRTAPVTRIVFNISTQGLKRLAPITASTGTVTAQKAGDTTVEWTGSASEVTFTVGAKADYGSEGNTKAGQLDFTSISVDPWTGVAPAKKLLSISLDVQKDTYNVNDALDKGTVMASFDDLTTADVTSEAVFSGYDLTTVGDYTVTVQYTYGGVTKEATYSIKVFDPNVTQYFTKVTSTPSSWVGTYLLVCEDQGKALTGSETEAVKIKKPTDVTISDGAIVADEKTTLANTITIEENETSGYLLKTKSGYYFYHTSNSSNGFSVNQNSATADDHEVTLSITEGGDAVITAHGAILRYNSGSSIFQFYKPASASGQTAVQLYKL